MANTIVVGVGNVLFKDEGVGVFAAKYLEQNYALPEDVEIIDGATLGFKLMTYFQDYDHVIILDTVSVEDTPGSIYRLPAEEMMGLGSYRQTAHEVEIVEMLEICSLLEEMAEVTILGIVPKDIEAVEIGLTPELEAHFDEYIDHAVKELETLGYPMEKTGDTSLKQISIDLIGAYNETRAYA